jgi:aspartyl-tRNA(Asn)/glutamyl-tRNA(Gln) amidotransferase subunit A
MSDTQMLNMSAVEMARAVRDRSLSARTLAQAALDRAQTVGRSLNAVTQVLADSALASADTVDFAVSRGEDPGPLAGVPVVLKDNICTREGFTTCGCRFLERYQSPFDATCVERLRGAGAVIIAKANLDEFAMGGSGENSAFGATRNPWDLSRVPGGSSSGSAACVASGIAPIALGSDTGGSIRQPAGFCGITGLKPTYGRVSRWGLVAFASSLDQLGPLARNARDAAVALSVISGEDPRDSTCARVAREDFASAITLPDRDTQPGIIGVARQGRGAGNHSSVNLAIDQAMALYRDAGYELVDVDLHAGDEAIAAYYIIAAAEASSNLARFDGVRYGRRAELSPGEGLADLYTRSRTEGFGPEVQRRIMLGTYVLSSGYYDAYYNTALKARRVIKNAFDKIFAKGCRAILLPASPGPAFKLGEKNNDPLAMYLEDIYTVSVNLAGLPAVTIPAGIASAEGKDLPVGVQLIGPALGEASLLRLASVFESKSGFHLRRPVL